MKSAPVIVVQLVHIEGPMKGEIQEFYEPEILIGRHPACHIQFPKDLTTISRKHASIVRDGNRFKMINQGANGTFVNGKRLEETYLKNGDVLTIAEDGPKVSFLTEMKEVEDMPSPIPPQQPAPGPERPSEPVMVEKSPAPPPRPEPPDPEAQFETPARPPQPEIPASQMQHKPASPPPKPQPPAPGIQQKPAIPPLQQKPAAAQKVLIQKIQVPLIIQHGPTLRSFKQVPVTIGKSHECDFVLNHPAIIDHHAQIFFSQDQYWIKDLTGKQAVMINGQPINIQAPLNPEDSLGLSASGPRFRFLGGGRLAEIEEPVPEVPAQEKPTDLSHEDKGSFSPKDQAGKVIKGAKDVLDKFLKR